MYRLLTDHNYQTWRWLKFHDTCIAHLCRERKIKPMRVQWKIFNVWQLVRGRSTDQDSGLCPQTKLANLVRYCMGSLKAKIFQHCLFCYTFYYGDDGNKHCRNFCLLDGKLFCYFTFSWTSEYYTFCTLYNIIPLMR